MADLGGGECIFLFCHARVPYISRSCFILLGKVDTSLAASQPFWNDTYNSSLLTLMDRCNAYNVSLASSCLLAVLFGVGVFFGVQDLHASKESPRTRS